MSTRTISRQDLYELVWSQPMVHIAREYGLSDVGLTKICRKYDIPRPPRGYWAKKHHGGCPDQIPLPDVEREAQILLPEKLPGDAEGSLEDQGIQAPLQVEVLSDFRKAHDLVRQARDRLHGAEVDDNKILVPPTGTVLRVSVSKPLLRRALLILDAVIRSVEGAGHTIASGPWATIDGITIGFEISEQVETHRRSIEECDLAGSYTFCHSRVEQTRAPTGRLALRIIFNRHWRTGLQQVWRDTQKRQLEERIGDFVAGMIRTANRVRHQQEQERVAAERRWHENRRQAEEAQRRAEKQRIHRIEQARVEQLMRDASDWDAARRLRGYINAVQTYCAGNPHVETNLDLGDWVEWATRQADRLDPSRPSPPSILDEDLGPESRSRQGHTGW
ncbi:MAG: hypothetical protein HND57_02605 [Planctomycetes bacterium]|nr:hypothetical protein [Planctomycetota bacterium]